MYPQSGVVTLISITTLQAIDARYTEVAARVGSDQEVTFEGEQITLDIPKDGIVLESGWTITPHTYPGVSLMLLYCLLTALSTELEIHSLLLLLCIETPDYALQWFITSNFVLIFLTRSPNARLTVLNLASECPPASSM